MPLDPRGAKYLDMHIHITVSSYTGGEHVAIVGQDLPGNDDMLHHLSDWDNMTEFVLNYGYSRDVILILACGVHIHLSISEVEIV